MIKIAEEAMKIDLVMEHIEFMFDTGIYRDELEKAIVEKMMEQSDVYKRNRRWYITDYYVDEEVVLEEVLEDALPELLEYIEREEEINCEFNLGEDELDTLIVEVIDKFYCRYRKAINDIVEYNLDYVVDSKKEGVRK